MTKSDERPEIYRSNSLSDECYVNKIDGYIISISSLESIE